MAHVALSMFQLLFAADSVTDGEFRKHEINSFAEVLSHKSHKACHRNLWKCYPGKDLGAITECGITWCRNIYRIRKKSSLLPCSIVPSFRFVQVVLTVCCGATVLLQSCWSQRIRSQATASTRRDAAESSMIQVNCEGKYLYLYIYTT